MSPEQVREILGDPDQRDSYLTRRAWIPFYSGPGAQRRVWTYDDVGQVVFSLDTRTGILQVIDVRGIGEIR
jgi:hypothetical protein